MKKLITLILSALMFTGCTGAGNSPNSTYRQISMEEAVAMMAQDQDAYRFTVSTFAGSAQIREQITALIEQCLTFTGDVDTQIAEAFDAALAACSQ